MTTTLKVSGPVSERFPNLKSVPFKTGQHVWVYDMPSKPEISAISECIVYEIGTGLRKAGGKVFTSVFITIGKTKAQKFQNREKRKLSGRKADFIFDTKEDAENYRVRYRIEYLRGLIDEKQRQAEAMGQEILELSNDLAALEKTASSVAKPPKKKVKGPDPFAMLDIEE